MIRIVVPGPPPRKNSRSAIAYVTPKKTKAWIRSLAFEWTEQIRRQPPERLAKRGAWSIRIDVYESRMRHLDLDVPEGDIDSTVTIVLDALQPRGIGVWAPLDDDARIISMTVQKHYDPDAPRVEIELTSAKFEYIPRKKRKKTP